MNTVSAVVRYYEVCERLADATDALISMRKSMQMADVLFALDEPIARAEVIVEGILVEYRKAHAEFVRSLKE